MQRRAESRFCCLAFLPEWMLASMQKQSSSITKVLDALPWVLLATASALLATLLLARWAVNAPGLGARDLGLAVLCAYLAGASSTALMVLLPSSLLAALVAGLRRQAPAWPYWGAAALAAAPLVLLA